ncbi:MAG: glycogen synthase GlgA [Sarcina sp.]
MKILFVATEAAPFIKSGGLGDVVGALSKELASLDEDVRVIIPKYKEIKDEYKKDMQFIKNIYVKVGWRSQYCGIETLRYKNVTYYFIDNKYYYDRDGIYGYYDEAERVAFFDRAVLETISAINWYPDIIHCNDWQTGMIPALYKLEYKYKYDTKKDIKILFSIHNLFFQGNYNKNILSELFGYNLDSYNDGSMEFYGDASFMKSALVYSDKILTVSNSYAEEIKTPEYGEGLDGFLRYKAGDLLGIVNGIDYEEFNPETDDEIYEKYNIDCIEKKMKNKLELQKELGLPESESACVISIISRLTRQKGIDLIKYSIEEILKRDVQLIILGTGDYDYEEYFKYLKYKYPEKVSANIKFDVTLSKKIYAGSDMFLMPSAFEPCGLGQLIALRYGTIPIVRETGGLRDTIEPFNKYECTGNGFSFYHYDGLELLNCMIEGLYIYGLKDKWEKLVENAMKSDNSWEKSAKMYLELYKNLV